MKKKRPFFKHYKKIFVNEFRGYGPSRLLRDLLAGLTVAAVSLPLALAFGAASVDAAHAAVGIAAGLITAIVSGLVIAALGGGSFQISGPTGAMTVVLGGIVSGVYGLQGMFVACLMSGVILLLAGLLRLGKLIQFIPRPVVTGFTSGIAVVIALGQLGNFLGVPLSGEGVVGKTINLFAHQLGDISPVTAACSLAVVLVMLLYPKKLAKYVPGSLAGIILLSAVCFFLKLDVRTVGSIPSSLVNSVRLDFTGITPEMLASLVGPAFTIAALGMIESLLCGVCAAKMKNEKFDSNVELIAQGVGNMIIPLFGGVPATAAIARTSVAVKSGGQTRLTSVFQALFLILCMFVLPGLISVVPYAVLAGVLMVTAWRMNDRKAVCSYFKRKMWDAVAMYLITLVATVFLDLTYAILIGVVLSLVIMVKNTKIQIDCTPLEGGSRAPDGGQRKTALIYSTGSLFFANAGELEKVTLAQTQDYQHLIFVMRGITYLDVSAADELCELVEKLRAQEKTFCFTGVSDEVRKVMDRCGFTELVGADSFYSSVDKVLLTPETANA